MENKLIKEINDCIVDMLNESADVLGSGYNVNRDAIEGAFTCKGNHCEIEITKVDIYRQLALIDTFYSTNVIRMRRFGLEEMVDEIYELCNNGQGKYTLGTLSSKLNATVPLHPRVKPLFTMPFGYVDGLHNSKAPSLLSKYFYFVALVCPIDNWGFPIYDSIVCGMLRPLQKKLGVKPLTPKHNINQSDTAFDMDVYINGLKRVIDVLEADNPALWNNAGKLKYDLLDYFLWHVGKAGMGMFEPLLTKTEYKDYLTTRQIPIRIQKWKSIYDKITK